MKWIIDLINLKIMKRQRDEQRWEPEPLYITPPEENPDPEEEEDTTEDEKKIIIIDI